MRFNQPIVGFLVGLVLPVLGFFVVYALIYRQLGFDSFFYRFTHESRTTALVISFSILANLIPFALTNRRYYYFAKGIFIVSMLYVALILWLRFVK